jgi:hypothetical protein
MKTFPILTKKGPFDLLLKFYLPIIAGVPHLNAVQFNTSTELTQAICFGQMSELVQIDFSLLKALWSIHKLL